MINRKLKAMIDFENDLLELRILTNLTREECEKFVSEIGEEYMEVFRRLVTYGYPTQGAVEIIEQCKENKIPVELVISGLNAFKSGKYER